MLRGKAVLLPISLTLICHPGLPCFVLACSIDGVPSPPFRLLWLAEQSQSPPTASSSFVVSTANLPLLSIPPSLLPCIYRPPFQTLLSVGGWTSSKKTWATCLSTLFLISFEHFQLSLFALSLSRFSSPLFSLSSPSPPPSALSRPSSLPSSTSFLFARAAGSRSRKEKKKRKKLGKEEREKLARRMQEKALNEKSMRKRREDMKKEMSIERHYSLLKIRGFKGYQDLYQRTYAQQRTRTVTTRNAKQIKRDTTEASPPEIGEFDPVCDPSRYLTETGESLI